MCGIIGYIGSKQAQDIMLKALETLEYRGYDSAGIAVTDPESKVTTVCKKAGRVKDLMEVCKKTPVIGNCGIGHTRWATHGGVCDENAHPHQFGKVTLIHNGIIENYRELTSHYGLEDKLVSQTDSEVAAAVIDHFYTGDPYSALRKATLKLKGTFAFAVIFADIPGAIFAIRNVSPIVIAKTKDGAMLSSDVTALSPYTKDYFVLPEYHVAKLTTDGIELYDQPGEKAEPDWLVIDWDISRSEKGGYPFFMEKEIMEQPDVINDTILPRIKSGLPNFDTDGVDDSLFKDCVVYAFVLATAISGPAFV